MCLSELAAPGWRRCFALWQALGLLTHPPKCKQHEEHAAFQAQWEPGAGRARAGSARGTGSLRGGRAVLGGCQRGQSQRCRASGGKRGSGPSLTPTTGTPLWDDPPGRGGAVVRGAAVRSVGRWIPGSPAGGWAGRWAAASPRFLGQTCHPGYIGPLPTAALTPFGGRCELVLNESTL